MRPGFLAPVLIILILLTDLASYRALRLLPMLQDTGWLQWVHFGITAIFIGGALLIGLFFGRLNNPANFRILLWFMGFFLMLYFPKLILGLTSLIEWPASTIAGWFSTEGSIHFTGVIRAGAILSALLFLLFAEGLFIGRTNIKVHLVTIPSERLPEAFRGLRIVQLSDIHLGGFYGNTAYMEKVVRQVNSLEPDLVLFTGDLVNNFAAEAPPFIPVLQKLKAREGKYAILGNHDYGKYYRWPDKEAEEANLEAVKQAVRDAGFRLLLNEHLSLVRGEDSITLAGVENWGKPPFPQFGDLEKALGGDDFFQYTILLSHDPSHWEAEVLPQSEVDLTLSGHTHAMQIGIEWGRIKWSPSGWMYKQWGGLYESGKRYLYVNRGIGYTGFPGRIGERPEITLLTLQGEDKPEL